MTAGGFKWIENASQFSKDFREKYNKDRNKGYALDVDIHYSEQLHSLHNDLLFLHGKTKIDIVEKGLVSVKRFSLNHTLI